MRLHSGVGEKFGEMREGVEGREIYFFRGCVNKEMGNGYCYIREYPGWYIILCMNLLKFKKQMMILMEDSENYRVLHNSLCIRCSMHNDKRSKVYTYMYHNV